MNANLNVSSNTELDNLVGPAKPASLKDVAFWSALVAANVGCIGLMVMLLFR
jgi:hypothetical protein